MPALARLFGTFALLLALLSAAGGSLAQTPSIPIPGLPGGLGGIGTQEEEIPNTPESLPPANPSPQSADPPQGGDAASAAPPTQALIDILRDDAAREALIRELEEAQAESGAAPPDPAAAADPPAEAAEDPPVTFGARAVAFTRAIGEGVAEDLKTLWLRAQRIPGTIELSLRAFEGDVLMQAVREVSTIAVVFYALLLLLRVVTFPIRRRIARAAAGTKWLKRVAFRVLASALDAVLVPATIFLGIFLMLALGLVVEDGDDVSFTDAQALFVNAFALVELARAGLRLILSPRSPEMRLIELPEAGILSMWRAGQTVIYVLGYTQLLTVPVVSQGISVFVGRAMASVLGAVVALGLMIYVMAHRKTVAEWLAPADGEGAFDEGLRALAQRWHWPVMVFLIGVFIVVLTRPGTVLLPLLWTTTQVILVAVIAAMLVSGLSQSSARRVRIPAMISSRLPLLEERLNSLVPAFLKVLRFAVIFGAVLLALDILNIQSLGGLLDSQLVERLSSGVFSVFLIALLLSLVWLAMVSWVDYRLNPFIGKVPTPREITLLTLMKNAVTVALIILGVITSLAQLGMNVGPLIASAGVIGLAISFGAQRMVEDIFSGIFIQAEGAMNVGDVVDVGGTVGTVEKLTVRSVTLRDVSGVVHVIPFSSAAKISNYMRDFAYHVADVGVAYREDLDEVKQAMHDGFDLLRQDPDIGPNIIGDLEWFGLNAFGASEVQMRARIKTIPGQQWGVGRAYNGIIKRLFDERGIEIPFPHQTVYFGESKAGKAPPIHVQMDAGDRVEDQREPEQPPAPAAPKPEPEERDVTTPPPASDFPDSPDR